MSKLTTLLRNVWHYRDDSTRQIDFMIIGIAKCGTSWLSARLDELPNVQRSIRKETQFFKFGWRDKYETWSDRRVRAHYLSRYWPHPRKQVIFEASPGYLSNPPSARRILQYTPTTRFVVLLRDPTKRAYSHYNMWVRKDGFEPSFEETYRRLLVHARQCYANNRNEMAFYDCVGITRPNAIIAYGLYYYHFKAWFEHFPREQFFIMTTPQLNDVEKIRGLLKFIGVDPADINHMRLEIRPKGGHKGEPISDAAYRELSEYYAPFNQKLFDLLGVEDLEW